MNTTQTTLDKINEFAVAGIAAYNKGNKPETVKLPITTKTIQGKAKDITVSGTVGNMLSSLTSDIMESLSLLDVLVERDSELDSVKELLEVVNRLALLATSEMLFKSNGKLQEIQEIIAFHENRKTQGSMRNK